MTPWEQALYREFEIHSGRRTIATRFSSSELQAATDYVRAFGSSGNEISVLGPDTVSWRGARFVAVPVLAPRDEHSVGIAGR